MGKKKLSELEETMALHIRASEALPVPEREYKFHPTRKWLFDFAFIDVKLAIETDGGIWMKGGHSSGKGI